MFVLVSHGTNCAGVIAGAANNGLCGVGVAYEANIAGIIFMPLITFQATGYSGRSTKL